MAESTQGMGKFIAVVLVLITLTALVAVLMPSLSAARRAAKSSMISASDWDSGSEQLAVKNAGVPQSVGSTFPAAQIRAFNARVDLKPTLSRGMASQESIYEVKVAATLSAGRGTAGEASESEVALPLPPQIISLSDLMIKVDGQANESLIMRGANLVWHGKLASAQPSKLEISYAAVGKGVYTLEIPQGSILDTYHIDLTAMGSDVRMPQLSLQPTELHLDSNQTRYTWDYKRLVYGRPIALNVLGVAAADKMDELSWLGPISVVFFGVMLALVAQAFRPEKLDHWMLLLIVGVFTSVYPLMYFAQTEIDSLGTAVLVSAALVVAIIGVRAVMLFGVKLGVAGVILPAAIILAVTLAAAIFPRSQGLLLTGQTIAFFVVATALAPRIKRNLGGAHSAITNRPLPPIPPTLGSSPAK